MSLSSDHKLVLLRHGESEWNKKNLFTGWRDVRLSEQGLKEAREAGRVLAAEGYQFDMAYTSLLTRAIQTLEIALDGLDQMWVPVGKSWRLNERHYGSLQGKNKMEAVEKFGAEQVQIWRRSYATPPPPAEKGTIDDPHTDRRYGGTEGLPLGESLKDVLARVLPYWEQVIVPRLQAGRTVLIAAHGNSLRALLKHLEGLSDEAIVDVNIPTGVPRAYKLDAGLKAANARYLGEGVEQRIAAVKAQTKT
ncbi:MAG TPA: 2,3-diphosphoglycerate-dependent phosphoglycerate mutase [Rhizomicrobium sp.]|nr:2,3-diphosphoglycerate-dependent phosphoglycerate mutase [Rhizomicrobium sp.]